MLKKQGELTMKKNITSENLYALTNGVLFAVGLAITLKAAWPITSLHTVAIIASIVATAIFLLEAVLVRNTYQSVLAGAEQDRLLKKSLLGMQNAFQWSIVVFVVFSIFVSVILSKGTR